MSTRKKRSRKKRSKKNSRTGEITLEEGKFAFNSYYNDLHSNKKKHIRQRAKKSDMQWVKKKKLLYPNKKGSVKYLSEKGPKTFDLWGVDAFSKDTVMPVIGEDNLSVQSKGVGPKTKSGKSYSEMSKYNYNKRYKNREKGLVDFYWDKEKNSKERKSRNKPIKWIMDSKLTDNDNDSNKNTSNLNKNKINVFQFNIKEKSDKNKITYRVLGIFGTDDLLLMEYDTKDNKYTSQVAKIINGQELLDDHSLLEDWSIKFFPNKGTDKLPQPYFKKEFREKLIEQFKNAVTDSKVSLNYGMIELENTQNNNKLGGGNQQYNIPLTNNNDTEITVNNENDLFSRLSNSSHNSNNSSDNLSNSSDNLSNSSNNLNNSSDNLSNSSDNLSNSSDNLSKLSNKIKENIIENNSILTDQSSVDKKSNLTDFSDCYSRCSHLFNKIDNKTLYQNGKEINFGDADFRKMTDKEKEAFFKMSKEIFNLKEINDVINQYGGKSKFNIITNQILKLLNN
jgi:hypothetical protein